MGDYLKNYIYKDKDLHSMLARTHVATLEQCKTFMGERRLQSHIKEGYIEEVSLTIKNRGIKEGHTLYRLTDEGKELAREKAGVASFYASNSARHDIAVSQAYVELYKKDSSLVSNWVTENDIKTMLQEKVLELREQGRDYQANRMEEGIRQGKFSACDGGYIDEEGELHAIEIISRHYKEETIEAKARTLRVLNVKQENYEETYID